MSRLLLWNDEIEVFFKLYLLLYADDTVILAESKDELQAALNAMYLYCKSWDLEVNPSKLKLLFLAIENFNIIMYLHIIIKFVILMRTLYTWK